MQQIAPMLPVPFQAARRSARMVMVEKVIAVWMIPAPFGVLRLRASRSAQDDRVEVSEVATQMIVISTEASRSLRYGVERPLYWHLLLPLPLR